MEMNGYKLFVLKSGKWTLEDKTDAKGRREAVLLFLRRRGLSKHGGTWKVRRS